MILCIESLSESHVSALLIYPSVILDFESQVVSDFGLEFSDVRDDFINEGGSFNSLLLFSFAFLIFIELYNLI